MKLIKFILGLILNIKNNTSILQFIIFIFLLMFLAIIGIFSLLKVVIPFTYIAL